MADQLPLWQKRFLAPQILNAQIAFADPQSGVVATNRTGRYQLYAWDVDSGKLGQLTDRKSGLIDFTLSPDGKWVYYLDDRDGGEVGHMSRFPVASGLSAGTSQDVSPDLPPYSPAGFSISLAGNLLGFTAATRQGFELYAVDVDPAGTMGESRLLYRSDRLFFGPLLSHDGDLAVIMSTEKARKPEYALYAFDTRTGERAGELWDGIGSSMRMQRFFPLPGDCRLLGTTNLSGTEQIFIWDAESGERSDLHFENLAGDLACQAVSRTGTRLLLQEFSRAVKQYYFFDLPAGPLKRLEQPAGTLGNFQFTPGGKVVASLSDAVRPSRIIALDAQRGRQDRVLLAAGEDFHGRSWQSVGFESSDGMPLQAWLATPPGSGPFPAVIDLVGGPGGVRTNSYHPSSQAWLDHGFAFLSLNYRGCASFGRDFERQIFGQPGRWEVEDIVAARSYLIETGISDPGKIFLSGWSYGGFLALLALGRRPELWAGAMAGMAIADWRLMYEDQAEMVRGYQRALFGGGPEEKSDQYASSSPITYANRVQAPVLIIQGRHDTRTPARQIVKYVAELESLGKEVRIHWLESGHGGESMDSNLAIEHQHRMLAFAREVLAAGQPAVVERTG